MLFFNDESDETLNRLPRKVMFKVRMHRTLNKIHRKMFMPIEAGWTK